MQRANHLQGNVEKGRIGGAGKTPRIDAWRGSEAWQKALGYNARSRVRPSLDVISTRSVMPGALAKIEHRASDVAVAVHVLHRMTELGRRPPCVLNKV